MMLLEYSRNYSYLFAASVSSILIAMGVAAAGFDDAAINFVAIMMPLSLAFLLVSQLRSGIALNSRWIAQYQRGTWQFAGVIVLNTCVLILVSTIAVTSTLKGLFD